MNEYLKVKEVHPHANFFVPENFEELFETYSADLISKKTYRSIKKSTLPEVLRVKHLLDTKSKFLEQEILFKDFEII